jgi:hypothetical protein
VIPRFQQVCGKPFPPVALGHPPSCLGVIGIDQFVPLRENEGKKLPAESIESMSLNFE